MVWPSHPLKSPSSNTVRPASPGTEKRTVEVAPALLTETTGTGLGLYLSRELCAANDARLTYRQAETGGAMFRISIRSH